MNKAVYIGAGLDVTPIVLMGDIDEFIYVDSQPFSEFGVLSYDVNSNLVTNLLKKDRNINSFSRLSFLDKLVKVMNQINFNLTEIDDDYYLFQYNNVKVKYYYSHSFPEYMEDNLKEDIQSCNTLIMCGYIPNKKVFELFNHPVKLVINNHTVYTLEKDDEDYYDSSIKYIVENPTVIKECWCIVDDEHFEYYVDDNKTIDNIQKYSIISNNNDYITKFKVEGIYLLEKLK